MSRGFTLTELIIAVSLSGLILMGIIGISAQMVRFQLQGARKGDVTGWTLLGLQRLNKEIENANVLDCPATAATSTCTTAPYNPSQVLSGCTNFTKQTNAPYDENRETVAFYYCVPAPGHALQDHLVRYELKSGPNPAGGFHSTPAPTCPITPVPATCGNTPASPVTMEVLVKGFYAHNTQANFPFFERADDVSGVRLRYQVGLATATAEISPTTAGPIPTYMRFDMKIGMNKSYTNTLD